MSGSGPSLSVRNCCSSLQSQQSHRAGVCVRLPQLTQMPSMIFSELWCLLLRGSSVLTCSSTIVVIVSIKVRVWLYCLSPLFDHFMPATLAIELQFSPLQLLLHHKVRPGRPKDKGTPFLQEKKKRCSCPAGEDRWGQYYASWGSSLWL